MWSIIFEIATWLLRISAVIASVTIFLLLVVWTAEKIRAIFFRLGIDINKKVEKRIALFIGICIVVWFYFPTMLANRWYEKTNIAISTGDYSTVFPTLHEGLGKFDKTLEMEMNKLLPKFQWNILNHEYVDSSKEMQNRLNNLSTLKRFLKNTPLDSIMYSCLVSAGVKPEDLLHTNYGLLRRGKLLYLRLYEDNTAHGFPENASGRYWCNPWLSADSIFIYLKFNPSFESLYSTLVHELAHALTYPFIYNSEVAAKTDSSLIINENLSLHDLIVEGLAAEIESLICGVKQLSTKYDNIHRPAFKLLCPDLADAFRIDDTILGFESRLCQNIKQNTKQNAKAKTIVDALGKINLLNYSLVSETLVRLK